MTHIATQHPLIAKAVRIVLVFALVFWSSFTVEAAAYAAIYLDDPRPHTEGGLYDLQVYSIDANDPTKLGWLVRDAIDVAKNKEQTSDIKVSTQGDPLYFAASALWVAEDAVEYPNVTGEAMEFISDFVEWSVDNKEVASITSKDGFATLTPLSEGTVTVTCKLNKASEMFAHAEFPEATAASPIMAANPAVPMPVTFTVYVKQPYVSSIEITRPDGTPCAQGEEIVLTEEERASYGFGAIVHVYDEVTGATYDYTTTAEQGLAEVSEGKLKDLTWSVVNADAQPVEASEASIDKQGVLTLTGAGPVSVQCTSPNGWNNTETAPVSVLVRAEEAPGPVDPEPTDRQGAYHPQDSLTINVEGLVVTPDSATQGSEGTEDGEATDGADGTEPANDTANENAGTFDADGDEAPAQSEPQNISKTYSPAEVEAFGAIEQTYTVYGADGARTITGFGTTLALLLNDVGVTTDQQLNIDTISFTDYRGVVITLNWADFTRIAAGSHVMVATRAYVHGNDQEGTSGSGSGTDSGSTTPASEDNAGTVTDSDSSASRETSTPSPADSSDTASATSDTNTGTQDTGELVENTRFRILYNASDASLAIVDPDALCSINTITVTMKPQEEKPVEKPKLRVDIDYVPVPYGYDAFLSAVPSKEIGNARFDFRWQTRVDEYSEWEDIANGTTQTLRVPTDEEHIGRWYRVILETNRLDEETGEYQTATSEPVQIQEGNGIVVVLDYVPPIAGDLAIFNSTIIDHAETIDPDVAVEYTWETSDDGGETWNTLTGERNPSLRIPTTPIDETASSAPADPADDSEEATIVYIRVRVNATLKDGTQAAARSNAQPLTVRVGESAGIKDGDIVIEEPINAPIGPTTPTDNNTDPTNPTDTPSQAQQPSQQTHKVTLHEIDFVQTESTPAARPSETQNSSPQPQPVETKPKPAKESELTDITDLLVNADVTAQVAEQQRAVDQAMAANHPGVKWTQLSAVNPNSDEVSALLATNPLAPFVLPIGLGVVVAGGVEKLLAFRRQTR